MPDVFVSPHEDIAPSRKRTPPPEGGIAQEEGTFAPPVENSQRVVEQQASVAPIDPSVPPLATMQTSPNSPYDNRPLVRQQRTSAIPLFTSFWQNPEGIYFDTQEANEHILLFVRKHFITNLSWTVTTLLAGIAPFGIFFGLQIANITLPLPAIYVRAIVLFYLLATITYGFINFLGWYYNISLITAKRVLDIELSDLVYKKIAATKISLIQDITYEQSGTIRSLFNYGDVLIQTAGTQDNFYILASPNPEVVVRVIENLIGREPGQQEEEREENGPTHT